MEDGVGQLTPFAGNVLSTSCRNGRCIEIRQFNHIRWMHFGDAAVQGCISLDSPPQLLLAYTQAMLAGFLFVDQPRRLLNLGLGCGSFVRFFQEKLPALQVDSVDHCEQVIEFAKYYFRVSETSPVYCETAEAFVAASQLSYDVIFCDLHANNGHPDCMFDASFYGNCYDRLSAYGVMAVNLVLTDEQEMLVLLQAVREHFHTLVLMAVPDHKNTILFAIKQPLAAEHVLILQAQKLQSVFDLDLSPYITQFRVLAGAAGKV